MGEPKRALFNVYGAPIFDLVLEVLFFRLKYAESFFFWYQS